jgi:hypothetical protein
MKIKIPIILACSSAIIFNLVNRTILSIGKLLYFLFPYKQNPMTSYPPYAGYDLALLLLCVIVFFLSVCIIIFRLFKHFSKS